MTPAGGGSAGLLLVGRYGQVAAVLRYLMLGSAAFGVAAVTAHADWPRLLTASLVPALSLRPGVVTGGLALLGTTLTSYGATALLTNPARSRARHVLTP